MKLLLLHGFTGRGRSWDAVRRHLPPGLETTAPDLPGHGGADSGLSTNLPPESLPASFEETVELLASRHFASGPLAAGEPRHLVGYSLGGRLALGLALLRPRALAGLTLIGARPGLDDAERPARAERDDALAAGLRGGDRGHDQGYDHGELEAFVDRWQDLPLFASQRSLPAGVLEDQRRLRLGHDPRGLAWALETLSPARMPDYRIRLGGLDLPVRLVVGELDAPYRPVAEQMAEALPRAEVLVVPGAGHNVPLEAPAALAEILADAVADKAETPR